MKVAFFSTKSYDKAYFDKYFGESGITVNYFEIALNKDTANLTVDYDAVCVFVNDKLDKITLQTLAKNGIKLIALRCAGFNNVDLEAAVENGIKTVRVPAYSPEAVAEHALALILTLNRKTHKAYNRVRESNFSIENLTGFNLYQKTVGIIGTGLIGSAFCKIMLGLGCKVIASDPQESKDLIQKGVQYVPLEDLLKSSDIISLHCPLNPKTKHIIQKESIGIMKDGLMLINTSRGALVNTKDVIDALKKGKIGYLGIDVYEQEEEIFFKDLSGFIMQDDMIARLMTFPNVLVTGHQGFLTAEALDEIAIITVKNMLEFISNKALTNEVKI